MQSRFIVREPGCSKWDRRSFDRHSAVMDLFSAFERGRTHARIYQYDVFGQQADVTSELTEEYYENRSGEY